MNLFSSLIHLFSHVSRRRRWQLGGLLVLMLVGAIAEMATLGAVVPFLALLIEPDLISTYPLIQMIFSWVGGTPNNFALSASILFAVIGVVAGLVRMLLMWASLRISFGLGADIGGEVYRRTLYQSYSWHVSRNSSEILAGIDKVNSVVYNVITPLTQAVISLVLSLGILAMLLAIDARTALVAGVGFAALYGITTFVLRRQVISNGKIISDNITLRVQALQEGLGSIRDVLLDGTQDIYHRGFAAYDYAMRRGQAANGFIGAAPRYIIESLGMVLIILLAYWLAGHQNGLIGSIPVLGALALGAQKILPQMQIFYQSWSSISGHLSQLEDVLKLLEHPILLNYKLPTQSSSMSSTVDIENAEKNSAPLICFHNISFRYSRDTPDVLHSINLEIPRGARIGFIGKTGSGKSTLIDLAMGLLEPSGGEIKIEGQPLTERNRRSWQSRIAHVPQHIYLSDTSIAENIALGVPKELINIIRVKEAATKAQLAEFIESLPEKYQTSAGERGVKLSGGQRQRIGLARALYKQADVLILDEATSALDQATEKSVMAAIKLIGCELTVLMIAHRITTLRDCDQIFELGNTSVLLKESYASLIDSVSGKFATPKDQEPD